MLRGICHSIQRSNDTTDVFLIARSLANRMLWRKRSRQEGEHFSWKLHDLGSVRPRMHSLVCRTGLPFRWNRRSTVLLFQLLRPWGTGSLWHPVRCTVFRPGSMRQQVLHPGIRHPRLNAWARSQRTQYWHSYGGSQIHYQRGKRWILK